MVSKPKPPVVKPTPTPEPKQDTRLDAVVALLLALEETLTGSAPPHLQPDIWLCYKKLKDTLPTSYVA